MIRLITAISLNGCIGQANRLPWSLKEDMEFFKSTTANSSVVMGRKTWESLGCRPLKGRRNIVVAANKPAGTHYDYSPVWASNPDDAITLAKSTGIKDIWIIGGRSLYWFYLMNHMVEEMYITHVNQIVNGDTFFPPIYFDQWLAEHVKTIYWDDDRYDHEAPPAGKIVKYTKKK